VFIVFWVLVLRTSIKGVVCLLSAISWWIRIGYVWWVIFSVWSQYFERPWYFDNVGWQVGRRAFGCNNLFQFAPCGLVC